MLDNITETLAGKKANTKYSLLTSVFRKPMESNKLNMTLLNTFLGDL